MNTENEEILNVEDLNIVHFPHPTLRYTSKPVTRVDKRLLEIVRRMFTLMYEAKGVGLAANQVDLPLRLFVVNVDSDPENGEELVFLNPVVSRPKGTEEGEEGCLSIPGIMGDIKRPKEVTVEAYNLQGEVFQARVDGYFARVIQHELDHLNGVLFPDRMSDSARANIEPVLDEFKLVFESKRKTGEVEDDEVLARRRAAWEARYCSSE